jgi:hypothetical protein
MIHQGVTAHNRKQRCISATNAVDKVPMSKITVHKLPLPNRKGCLTPSPESRGSRSWHPISFELFAPCVSRILGAGQTSPTRPPPTRQTLRGRWGRSVVKCPSRCLGVSIRKIFPSGRTRQQRDSIEDTLARRCSVLDELARTARSGVAARVSVLGVLSAPAPAQKTRQLCHGPEWACSRGHILMRRTTLSPARARPHRAGTSTA